MRLFLVFLILAAIVLTIFFLWGDRLIQTFSLEGSVRWLSDYGAWAWAAGMVLLMADLVLPLPATLIMSGIGYIYGPVAGGLIASAGSFLAGAAGYWLCRIIGDNAARNILGEKDFARGKRFANRDVGGWIVVLSRWLPVFPEVISCMAGLARMSPLRFHAALLCGALPMGFAYAYIGHAGVSDPVVALFLSALVPPVIWLIAGRFINRRLAEE